MEDEDGDEDEETECLYVDDEDDDVPWRWRVWCWFVRFAEWTLPTAPLPGGPCCRFSMLSMAHCRCSLSESSGGGLPLEKLALSISGESDLHRFAGSDDESLVQDVSPGDGGPGACWSI